MDNETATRILAKELGNKLERTIVIEESYKDSLVKNASSVYQIGDPLVASFYDNKFHSKKARKGNVSDLMLVHDPLFAEANYYFMRDISNNKKGLKDPCYIVTSYAMIGKKEKSALKKLFYNNVKPEITDAMRVIGIENFVRLYEQYIRDGSPFTRTLKELKLLKEFIDHTKDFEYNEYDCVHKGDFSPYGGIDWLNDKFKKVGLNVLITPDFDGDVHESVISEVTDQLSDILSNIQSSTWNPLLSEFINFVFFSLPYEEQNIKVNKKFLKECPSTGFVIKVLLKEYSRGKYFQEYFSGLNKKVQKEVVQTLRNSPKNPSHDHFLWSEGFDGFSIDTKKLYKDDPDYFIKYFKGKTVEEKKSILKEIMEYDFENEKVVKFLNKKHLDLVREVGFNG